MDRVWRPMPVAPHAAVPPLLVATSFGPAAYSVAVTDLARVWSESLDRRGICMRAFQENTTIDPSYDNEQMGVFLAKIKAAFASSAGPQDAYSLSLASADDGLLLHITCALPGGLPPLKWPLHLSLSSSSSSSSSSSLVVPLLQDRARSQRSTAALVAALRQKDAVIAKLVDKLDAMGAGAESAFPSLLPSGGGGGASSRRAGPRLSRADMERRIKGLAPFDEAVFRKQLEAPPDDVRSLLSTFGELPCGEDDGSSADGNWWQSLGTGTGVALTRTTSGLSDAQTTRAPESEAQAAADDDGFQTTPSRAIKTAATDSDPPSPTPARPPGHASSAAPTKAKGLGKIGGRLGAVGKKLTPAKADEQPTSLPSPAGGDDNETASEAEADEPEEKPEGKEEQVPEAVREKDSAETVAAVRPKPARGGLGRIGGKKEPEPCRPSGPEPGTAEPEPDAVAGPETREASLEPREKPPSSPPPAAARARARAGLGRIGKGVAKQDTDEEASDDGGKRKADTKAESQSQPPIAETKRAEILQQAVAKNAAPVRKKRKF